MSDSLTPWRLFAILKHHCGVSDVFLHALLPCMCTTCWCRCRGTAPGCNLADVGETEPSLAAPLDGEQTRASSFLGRLLIRNICWPQRVWARVPASVTTEEVRTLNSRPKLLYSETFLSHNIEKPLEKKTTNPVVTVFECSVPFQLPYSSTC